MTNHNEFTIETKLRDPDGVDPWVRELTIEAELYGNKRKINPNGDVILSQGDFFGLWVKIDGNYMSDSSDPEDKNSRDLYWSYYYTHIYCDYGTPYCLNQPPIWPLSRAKNEIYLGKNTYGQTMHLGALVFRLKIGKFRNSFSHGTISKLSYGTKIKKPKKKDGKFLLEISPFVPYLKIPIKYDADKYIFKVSEYKLISKISKPFTESAIEEKIIPILNSGIFFNSVSFFY